MNYDDIDGKRVHRKAALVLGGAVRPNGMNVTAFFGVLVRGFLWVLSYGDELLSSSSRKYPP